ncbi:uncharacterized protein LOC141661252 [Apium graveolens]|uniref:uncharacterized protein LOC141661252 n=1 Tax=Apium graveolens TaxID=4045 RepID=UPI003D7A0B53
MRVFMQAQGVWKAIEPKGSGAIDDKVDKTVMATIYQGVPDDVLLILAEKTNAKDTWKAVKTMSPGADHVKTARVQTLKSEFEAIIMKETDSLDKFYLKLNGMVTNIRALGEAVEESYVQFENLETMAVEKTISSLKAHEERLRGQPDTGNNQLLLTEEAWSKREKEEGKLLLTREEWLQRTSRSEGWKNQINRCGGEYKSKEPVQWVKGLSKVHCFNCSAYRHFAIEFKKLKRDRETTDEAHMVQILDEEPALLFAKVDDKLQESMLVTEDKVTPRLKAEGSNTQFESNLWYLDNGASNHLSGQISKFRKLDKQVTGKVKFGDGSMVQIKGKGTVILQCKNGEERVLNDVYYIPSLCSNIISLRQLSEEGHKVILSSEYLWIRGRKEELLMKVKQSMNRLYKVILYTPEQKCLLSRGKRGLVVVFKVWSCEFQSLIDDVYK